ncbi:hypothetical protein GUJ93_ZPchr0007g4459 [Zizania palustris]|uniref:Uncharacterized protein n=1 Tax=Zizania palustris TaxID=103762 RepID=A0A8J5T722_ZIZPA|nr:hypothetical protein GUJ93_ZPchr0007g4459 [Zizania palustris]
MVDAGAAVASRPNTSRRNSRRSAMASAALSPSNSGALVAATKHKAVVASRYLVPSSKPTSGVPATSTCSSASPAAPRRSELLPNVAVADTAKRTLSVAFQGHSYSLGGASKAKPVLPATAKAVASPEKKRFSSFGGAAVRTNVSDARWPTPANAGPYVFRSVAARSVAFNETPRRASVDVANPLHLLYLSSDTESASSAGSQDVGAAGAGKLAPRSRPSPRSIMSSPARFSLDAAGSRSARLADQSTPFMSRTPRFLPSPSPNTASPAPAPTKKKKSVKSLFNGLLSSPFTRPSLKQPPPTKPATNPPAMPSPVRSSAASASATAPGLAGKLQMQSKACSTDCRAEEEHMLRLLHNQHLQWRRANAKAGAALSAQALNAQKHLCGAWVTILGMRKSIALKKMQLQLLRDSCKLMAVLRGQMVCLEEWSLLENKYDDSLSGTVEALNATILRLPVSDGAMAEFPAVRNAVGSAVDVMQAMRNSMANLLLKLARTNVLVSQLSRIATQEQALMSQCRELLSTLALMHVKHSSLQGQMIQMSHPEKAKTFLVSSEYSYCSLTEACSCEEKGVAGMLWRNRLG